VIYRSGDHILTLATAPASIPVSLDNMKAHLRVDGSDEDMLISAYLNAATAALDGEGELSRAIITQSWDEAFKNPSRDVYLSMKPAASLTSVKYYDTDNVEQTATLGDFTLYSSSDWAFVRSDSWPATYDRPDAITVRYVAGEASAPENIVQAVKLIVSHWYQNREDTSELNLKEIPRAASHLIGLSRLGWYG